jgi:hypothetical protein
MAKEGIEVNTLIGILKEKGKVLVNLLDHPWDESWGEKGMIAEISYVGEKHADHEFRYDYNKHKDHNLTYQKHDWFIDQAGATGTAFEAGMMDIDDIHEEVYHEGYIPVEIIEEGFLAEYIKKTEEGCNLTYIQWLEHNLENAISWLEGEGLYTFKLE